ncbi:hypothetical protein HK096_011539, partial [Nowakowskiella sp. JEL0078]
KLTPGIAKGIAAAHLDPNTKLPLEGVNLEKLDYLAKEDYHLILNLIREQKKSPQEPEKKATKSSFFAPRTASGSTIELPPKIPEMKLSDNIKGDKKQTLPNTFIIGTPTLSPNFQPMRSLSTSRITNNFSAKITETKKISHYFSSKLPEISNPANHLSDSEDEVKTPTGNRNQKYKKNLNMFSAYTSEFKCDENLKELNSTYESDVCSDDIEVISKTSISKKQRVEKAGLSNSGLHSEHQKLNHDLSNISEDFTSSNSHPNPKTPNSLSQPNLNRLHRSNSFTPQINRTNSFENLPKSFSTGSIPFRNQGMQKRKGVEVDEIEDVD